MTYNGLMNTTRSPKPYRLAIAGTRTRAFKTLGAAVAALRRTLRATVFYVVEELSYAIALEGRVLFAGAL